jgi:Yip1 domain
MPAFEDANMPKNPLMRIKDLIFHPGTEWAVIARETSGAVALCARYLLPLALLAPIATVIGMMFFDYSWDQNKGFRIPRENILTVGVANYFFAVLTVLLIAAVFFAMTRIVDGQRNWMASLKVAVYGAIPLLLSGVVLFMPVNVIVCLVAMMHTLALYYSGVQTVMKIKETEAAMFVGASMIIVFFASTLLGALASSLGMI